VLYSHLHALLKRHPGWSLCAITSDPNFERAFGQKADKRRKLYNGRLECQFLTYLSEEKKQRYSRK
jgi:putative N6-adenine-specific DNA methylase